MVTLRRTHSINPEGLQLRWNESSGFSVKNCKLALFDLTSHLMGPSFGVRSRPPLPIKVPSFSNIASFNEVFPLTR